MGRLQVVVLCSGRQTALPVIWSDRWLGAAATGGHGAVVVATAGTR